MNLGISKTIVGLFWGGHSYAWMTLEDLDSLGNALRMGGVDSRTATHRDHAIIDRKPWLLYARQRGDGVACASSDVPIAALPADGFHGSVSSIFESVAASTRTAAAAWSTELAIEATAPVLRGDPVRGHGRSPRTRRGMLPRCAPFVRSRRRSTAPSATRSGTG